VTSIATVWVTRPADTADRTSAALTQAGFHVLAAPLLAVRPVAPEPLPPRAPDWLVLVSPTAVHGFVAALTHPGFPVPALGSFKVAAVGQSTARAARQAGLTVNLVPASEHAEGLLVALHSEVRAGACVWIPTGNRHGSAKDALPAALTAIGAQVCRFHVYDTLARPLAATDLAALAAATPGAIVLHSPSAADALFDDTQPAPVMRWRADAALFAIGARTSERVRALGGSRVYEAPSPNDAALVTLLRAQLVARSFGGPR